MQKLLSNTTPLCFMPDGKLVCYQHGDIVILLEGTVVQEFKLFHSAKEQLLGRSKLISRFLRLGIRSAISLDHNHILLSHGDCVYELDLLNNRISEGWYCGDGVRPLIFTDVKNINGFKDGVYFGGYLINMDKKPVNIYHRIGKDKWDVVYTFQHGAINHVHNVVADPYRNCLWIFTGDFDEASAIWKITDNFRTVERVAYNDQKYRGCVVYALPEGLLYATDAPFTNDYIYLMNPETYETKELFPLNGSCIYGCQWKDKFVFSSTVEGDGRESNIFKKVLNRKRGKGILDDYIHMYIGNVETGFKEIYKSKKDWLPFYLFQFGVFKFPYNLNNTDFLYFQSFATRNNDLALLCFENRSMI